MSTLVSNQQTMLVVGNDAFGRKLADSACCLKGLHLAVDRSVTTGRVLKLLRRGSLTPKSILLMGASQFAQSISKQPDWPSKIIEIKKNADLIGLIEQLGLKRVVLFRAGLIVNAKVLGSGAEILNIHCAKLPEYGGLNSIQRALDDKAYQQAATLHRVTERIDSGETIVEYPYRLDRKASYITNERHAYEAGIQLAMNFLTKE